MCDGEWAESLCMVLGKSISMFEFWAVEPKSEFANSESTVQLEFPQNCCCIPFPFRVNGDY